MELQAVLLGLTAFTALLAVIRSVSILGRVCSGTNHRIRIALWLVAVSAFTTLAQTLWTGQPPIEGLVAVLVATCAMLYLDRRNVRNHFQGMTTESRRVGDSAQET